MEFMETIFTATASATTKISGTVSVLAAIPTGVGAVSTGEWSAVAVGAAVTGITAVFALVGLVKDKVRADQSKQIAELIAENRAERQLRKSAEDISDQWERRFHRLERKIDELGGTPDPDSETHP